MELTELWMLFKDIFIDIVKYGFPTVALILSLLSFIDSRKTNKIRDRLNDLEEKLKNYELEEKEIERFEATKACVEARIFNISKQNYRMKIWNSGKANAFNVDFELEEECKANVWKEKVPYEFLESGKSFEERVLVYNGTPSKFKVTTTWKDDKDKSYSKDQIVTI